MPQTDNASAPQVETPPRSTVNELLTLITEGHLSPGQRIDQREISQQLGISRTPLREALKALEADGILRHENNRGYTVSKLSGHELMQYHHLRFFLEGELIATMQWPDDHQLAALKAANDRYTAAGAAGTVGEMSAANRDFHFLMFSWSTERVYYKEVVRIWRITDAYQVARFSTAGRRNKAVHDHASIIKAIESKNRKRLVSLMNTHQSRAVDLLTDFMGAMPLTPALASNQRP